MSNKKQEIPAIRFNGFTDAWEQRRLNEISIKVTEKNKDNEFVETFTNSAEFGIISQRDFFDKDISNEKNLNTYYIVRNDDFVYNPRISNFAPVGPIKRNKLNKTGVMSPLYYVFRTLDINKTYLENYFNSSKWHKFMKLNGDSGARSDRFAIKDSVFNTMPIPYPNLFEQEKIGTLINYVENTITLHQRQLDNYREWKKAMVQKMFPHDGEKIPEVRFEGFTGEWEERKVNDIFHEIFSGNRLPKTSLVEGEVPYIIAKVTNNGEFMKIDNNSLDYHGNKMKLFPSPSITFSIDNPEAIFVQKYPFFTSNIMRVLHNPSLSYNQNIFFYLWIKSLTTYFNWSIKFSGPVVMNSIIYIPINQKGDAINFDEIERVGGFFKQLDDTITLQQQKVNDYQQLKDTMLQQMFV